MDDARRADRRTLLTIGHSNHEIDRLLHVLRQHSVECVADVRSAPYSRYAPWYNAEALKATLPRHDVGYLYLGQQLGGRPAGMEFYLTARPRDGRRISPARLERGYVDYARLAATTAFREGIDRLIEGCSRLRVAVMCSEEDPSRCHRHWLIAHALLERGVEVQHLRADDTIQSAVALFAAAREQAPVAIQPSLFD